MTSTIADDLGTHGSVDNSVEAALRAAARPVEFTPFGHDERAAKHLALPPGWQHIPVEPEEFRTAPDLQHGTYRALTADGFVTLLDGLIRGEEDATATLRYTASLTQLAAVVDPGTRAKPAFENLRAILEPQVSDELNEWLNARQPHDLKAWPRFVEDHIPDIDAAAFDHSTARSGADVLDDAQKWNVTSRRELSALNGDVEDYKKAEYEAKVVGEVITSFKIRIPILRFGEPRTITVALTRDLERATVAPRLPGIERIINAAIEAEITAAETTLGVDVIR